MHRETRADVTCAVRTVPIEEAHRFGILDVDGDGRVTALHREAGRTRRRTSSAWASTSSAGRSLRELLSPERVDFGRDVLPWMVEDGGRVFAYEFGGYWQDVGTVESYWQTSLDLLSDDAGHRAQRPRLADLHPERGAAAGAHRAGGVGLALDDQPRLRDRGHGRAQRPVAGRAGRAPAPSCATRS